MPDANGETDLDRKEVSADGESTHEKIRGRDLDSRLNEALELTFPCSDPIAVYVERTPEPDEDPEADPKSKGEQEKDALPKAAVTIEDGEITITADLLRQQLGLSVGALKAQTRRG